MVVPGMTAMATDTIKSLIYISSVSLSFCLHYFIILNHNIRGVFLLRTRILLNETACNTRRRFHTSKQWNFLSMYLLYDGILPLNCKIYDNLNLITSIGCYNGDLDVLISFMGNVKTALQLWYGTFYRKYWRHPIFLPWWQYIVHFLIIQNLHDDVT